MCLDKHTKPSISPLSTGIDYFVREGGGGGRRRREEGSRLGREKGAGAGSIVGIASAILRIRIRNTQNPES